MNNAFRKCAAFLSAAALSIMAVPYCAPVMAADETSFPYTIEGEDMEGAELWTSIYNDEFPDYSGEGFTYLNSGALSFKVTVPEDGMYQINARCVQILDEGGRFETIAINGVEYSKTVPYYNKWTDVDFGVVRLRAGENEISFLNKYGYLAIDTVTVSEAVFPDVTQATGVPCDVDADKATKSLMSYLQSVYGSHILSGQQEIYGGGHDDDPDGYDKEFEFLKDLTGSYPAIRGFDFMNYNPLYGWDDGTTERAIDWAKNKNGIITACWHINLPTDFDSYEVGEEVSWEKCSYKNNAQFKIANAVKEGTKENDYLNLAIEDLAEQFQKLQDAGVPIMFRPFHEAEGNGGADGSGAWFWWSQDGAEDYKELWKYLYNKLTGEYDLHNIIWLQNLYAWSDESAEWYVGDDYVDIVGFDKYDTVYNRHDGKTSGPNEDCNSNVYWSLVNYVNNNKMAAVMENSTIPSLANMQTEKASWLYFCTWYDNGQDNFISGSGYNDPDSVVELMTSDYCINLEDLPADLYTSGGSGETTKPTTTATTSAPAESTTTTAVETTSGESTTLPESSLLGDANEDGKVTIADAAAIIQALGNPDKYALTAQGMANADCYNPGDGITALDALAIQKLESRQLSELPEMPETE